MRFFPYAETYAGQREAIDRIGDALEARENVLFEGACGTGKTLAALVPALAHARRGDKTVVITTNVHQQMRQFIAEARAINRTTPIRAVVFRGKASMCHVDVGYEECQVLRDTTHDRVDLERDRAQLERRQRELLEQAQAGDSEAAEARGVVMDELDAVEDDLADLQDRSTCDHYYENLTADRTAFDQWLFEDVRTPDEVYAWAGQRGFCGYELLKDAMDDVDLVVCNYHHLLDPAIRLQFFQWLDREPKDIVAVFDEAHNIERAAREHASRALSERTLVAALDELDGLDDSRATRAETVIEAFYSALTEAYEADLGFVDVGHDWTDVTVANDGGSDDLTSGFEDRFPGRDPDRALADALELGRELDDRYETAYREGETATRRESGTLQSAAFIDDYLAEADAEGQYPVVSVRRDEATDEVYGRAELYACIPREITRSLFDSLHASVLMSATLRPFDVTADVLGLDDPRTMAYGLRFPEANRRTLAVDVPPLFASKREDPAIQETVRRVLEDTVAFTPGSTLAFFPSYSEAARYADLVETDASVYLDEPGVRVQELKESFVADDDAIMFTSLWGTLTEGVSFDGDQAQSVIVVGVPYPHLDDRLQAVQDAYDEAFDAPNAGWEYAVEIPTVRKTRQALGRALRSPDEVGVRVLADRRYTSADMGRYGVRSTFPRDEREELVDVMPEKLRYALLNFYSDHEAWDGTRPTP